MVLRNCPTPLRDGQRLSTLFVSDDYSAVTPDAATLVYLQLSNDVFPPKTDTALAI